MRLLNDKRVAFLMYLTAVGLMLIFPSWALAHESASHSVSGFSAGFLHPLTGFDHLLMLVSVGVFSVHAKASRSKYLTVAFAIALTLGFQVGVHLSNTSMMEAGVALSLLMMAGLLISSREVSIGVSFSLVGLFGFLHGIPHGAEMPVATSTASYLMGMLLAASGVMCLSTLLAKPVLKTPHLQRSLGFALLATALLA